MDTLQPKMASNGIKKVVNERVHSLCRFVSFLSFSAAGNWYGGVCSGAQRQGGGWIT